jgi:hypothetical protein
MENETDVRPLGRQNGAGPRSRRVLVLAVMCVLPVAGWSARAWVAGRRSPEHASAVPSSSAQDELSRLDTRAPDPLTPAMAWDQKQRMLAFMAAIEQVSQGLADDDWEMVTRAAAVLGTSPEARAKCRDRSGAADAISAMALEFRCRGDTIGEAARARDRVAALRATSETLKACNGCHAVFRQDVVDASTWRLRTRRDERR